MDCRLTLGKQETFVPLLQELQQQKRKAAMLLDINGLERMEGLIATLDLEAAEPFVILEDGSKAELADIVAINGTFAPDYAGC